MGTLIMRTATRAILETDIPWIQVYLFASKSENDMTAHLLGSVIIEGLFKLLNFINMFLLTILKYQCSKVKDCRLDDGNL
jgi:hypothetical protein